MFKDTGYVMVKNILSLSSLDLRIAGFIIRLHFEETEYLQTKKIFLLQLLSSYKGFMVNKSTIKADFTIQIAQMYRPELLRYKEKNYIEFYTNTDKKKIIRTFYSIGLEQFVILLRSILFALLSKTGFFLHGSVGILNDKALLFIGRSGVGKSTIIQILKKDVLPFADDAFIVRKIDGEYFCFQTPFLDKQLWIKKSSKGYLIKTIFLLNQSKKTYIMKEKIADKKLLLVEEIISNPATLSFFTKNFLAFINKKSICSLYFNLNKSEILQIIVQNNTNLT